MNFNDDELKCILDLFVAYADEKDDLANKIINKLQLFSIYKEKEVEFMNFRNEFVEKLKIIENNVDKEK